MKNYSLTKEEIIEYNLINYKFDTANKALETNVILSYDFTDEQLYQYLQAAYNSMAEAKLLDMRFLKKLKEKMGLGETELPTVMNDYTVMVRG